MTIPWRSSLSRACNERALASPVLQVKTHLARACLLAMTLGLTGRAVAGAITGDWCPRPAPGSVGQEPKDLRSHDGMLKLDLTIHDFKEKDGSVRYCYLLPDGTQSPTLRLHPGDLLILHLTDRLVDYGTAVSGAQAVRGPATT